MKKLFTLLVLVLGLAVTVTAQVEKTLVKSIALEASTSATIALPGKVNITEWDNDFIRVTTNLKVENMNEGIVKQLVIVGRYTLETDVKTGELVITMPKMANMVTVKGVQLVEVLNFDINAPEGFEVVVKGGKEANDNLLGQTL